MNYYKITYSVNDKHERIYPKKMKGVVFVSTQDHSSEHVMVAGTGATMEADGKNIVALSEEEAEAMIEELRDSFPEPPPQASESFPPIPEQG